MSIEQMLFMANKEYSFKGNKINYHTLKEFKNIKIYTESSHFDRKLKQDSLGNLYLYEFYEYVSFGNDGDEIYETYTLVRDECDADILNKQKDIRRKPYIRVNPGFYFNIVE
jgi:hypothetical protein